MTALFRHQFCIFRSDDQLALPPHFVVSSLAGYQIATCPRLPVSRLVTRDGVNAGFVLGWAVKGTMLLKSKEVLNIDSTTNWRQLENELYNLAGRWLAFVTLGKSQRVYLDPLASHSTVYSQELRRVASTPYLLGAKLNPLLSELELIEQDHWYPAGLTAYKGVSRVLANHCIDLANFCHLRHWPRLDSDIVVEDTWRSQIQQIRVLIQQQLVAYSANMPLRIGLTAGLESRAMLACSRGVTPVPLCWTRCDKSSASYQDVKTATFLATSFSLQHIVLPFKKEFQCTNSDIAQFLINTGYCVGGSPLRSHKLIDSAGECFALTGIGGEIARAYYESSSVAGNLSGTSLLAQTGLPRLEPFSQATDDYLQNMPKLEQQQQLALFYLENRVTAFGAVHRYAYQSGLVLLSPFSHRTIVSCMLKLPVSAQLDAQFHKALIEASWPELLLIPFNTPLNIQDKLYIFYQKVKKHITYSLG